MAEINVIRGTGGPDNLVDTDDDDQIIALAGDDTIRGRGGNDIIEGGAGDDTAFFNVDTDGRDEVDLGTGSDVVRVTASGQVRLTFTSAEVGNTRDSGPLANQDGGLAVRLNAENANGVRIGPTSRFDDEGITFVASAGSSFDVRDLVSGVQRGDRFEVVTLGTSDDDVLTAIQADRPYY